MNPTAKPTEKRKELEKFADWVNPMLVKELRQGLRSKAFIGIFLGLQLLLGFIFLTMMGDETTRVFAAEKVGGFIYGIFVIFVVIAQPIRGLTALSSEMKDGHMELVSLTQLRSWKVVWSKWNSIMLQTFLIFFSLLPFIFVRYFFGGMDVLAETIRYILAVATSGVLVAIMIAISACSLIVLRGIFTIGVMWLAVIFMRSLFSSSPYDLLDVDAFTPSWSFLWSFLALLAGGAYLIYLSLITAVRSIAPAAENHSTGFRLVTLGVITLTCLITFFKRGSLDEEIIFITFFGTVGILGFYCLAEKEAEVGTYLAISRRERFPLHGWLTAPGWQFGFWVFTLGSIIAGIPLYIGLGSSSSDALVSLSFIAVIIATALFPLIILRLLRRKITIFSYLCSLLVMSLIAWVLFISTLNALTPKSPNWLAWPSLFFPPLPMAFLVDIRAKIPYSIAQTYAVLSILVCFLYWLIVAGMSILTIRKQLKEREAD